MKKFILLLSICYTIINFDIIKAQDIWIDHWNDENIDVYVINDTIQTGNDNGRWIRVVTKSIRDGKLIETNQWSFSNFRNYGEWRYRTDRMEGHTNRVIENGSSGKILKYCIEYLGI